MAKKEDLTISIDKELKKRAREANINFSKFVSDMLKEELDFIEKNEYFSINRKIEDLYQKSNEIERELEHLQRQRRRLRPISKDDKIDKIWQELRIETSNRLRGIEESDYDPDFIETCEDQLEHDFMELLVITVWFFKKNPGFTRWSKILEVYKDPEKNPHYNMKNSKYILKDLVQYVKK